MQRIAAAAMVALPAHAEVGGSFRSLTPADWGTGTLLDFSDGQGGVVTDATLSCPGESDAASFLATPGTEEPVLSPSASDPWSQANYLAMSPAAISTKKGHIAVDGSYGATGAFGSSNYYSSDASVRGDLVQFLIAGRSYSLGFICWADASYTKLATDGNGKAIVVYGTLSIEAAPSGVDPNLMSTEDKQKLHWTFSVPKQAAKPTLTASAAGQTVTLTAALPSAATGSVEFFEGATSLGSVALSGGSASKLLTDVSEGDHSYTAVYAGDATYNGGTSDAATVNVQKLTVPPVNTTVTADVPAASGGELTLTGASTASLGKAVQKSDNSFQATGNLGTVTVTDSRASKSAWSLSGIAGAFSGPSGATLPASALGWAPAADTGATLPGNVTVGAAAAGLGSAQPLATSTLSTDAGVLTAKLNAALTFTAPAGTPQGTYTTTLQLTLI